MKLNKIYFICLIIAVMLTGSVLFVSAAGFVSYEDNNKIVIWDPVKMIGKGLKMSSLGINDLEDVPDGKIKIDSKDLYVRKFMAFDCPNYPATINCSTTIGDIGGRAFLRINRLKGDVLYLNSESSGFSLNLNGPGLDIKAKLILTDNKNLIVTDDSSLPPDFNSVYADTLKIKTLGGAAELKLPGLQFNNNAFFSPKRLINISL